jgi:hypothetical protein
LCIALILGSSVSIVTVLRARKMEFRTRVFFAASSQVLRPTQPPIQWIPGALSLGVKRPGRETDYSHPSSAEVKECVELYLHSSKRLHGVVFSSGLSVPPDSRDSIGLLAG